MQVATIGIYFRDRRHRPAYLHAETSRLNATAAQAASAPHQHGDHPHHHH